MELTFLFEQSDPIENVTIGDITGVRKGGWEYLWVHYEEQDDQAAGKFVRRADGVYVERVYDFASLAQLGIGNG